MKRIVCMIVCALLMAALVVPAAAANMTVVFTSDSKFEAGGTVKVDVMATQQSVMNDPSVTADYYNAALEGDIQFYWFRNDSWHSEGTVIHLTEEDKGCEFFCRAIFYSDADHTQQFGALDSATFTVPNTGNPALYPEITTKSLANGTVGESYYQKLECTEADVTYSLFRSSLPDGLYLTQHGEIEGVPTKAGTWYVVIMVTPETGAEYANTAEFEITISEAGPEYTIEIQQLPNKLTYTSGEKLDLTGLRVRIWTPDGYIDSRDGARLTYTDRALVTVGEQKIKLAYEDAFEIFIVTVVAAPEEPTTPATEPTAPATEPTTPATEPTTPATEPTATPTEPVTVLPGDPPADPTESGSTEATEEATRPSLVKPGKNDKNKSETDEEATNENPTENILVILLIVLIAVMVGVLVVGLVLIGKLRKRN